MEAKDDPTINDVLDIHVFLGVFVIFVHLYSTSYLQDFQFNKEGPHLFSRLIDEYLIGF